MQPKKGPMQRSPFESPSCTHPPGASHRGAHKQRPGTQMRFGSRQRFASHGSPRQPRATSRRDGAGGLARLITQVIGLGSPVISPTYRALISTKEAPRPDPALMLAATMSHGHPPSRDGAGGALPLPAASQQEDPTSLFRTSEARCRFHVSFLKGTDAAEGAVSPGASQPTLSAPALCPRSPIPQSRDAKCHQTTAEADGTDFNPDSTGGNPTCCPPPPGQEPPPAPCPAPHRGPDLRRPRPHQHCLRCRLVQLTPQ